MTGPSSRRELAAALTGVEGWFDDREAWRLHRVARDLPGRSPLAVEIGSWMGRSTLALGLAFRARGAGTVVAIDPHAGSVPHERFGVPDAFAQFERNVAPVATHVRAVRATSLEARTSFDEPVDLLFVDGSHRYEDVLADVDAWSGLLRRGATIALHDAQHAGVGRAVHERLLCEGPFRRPRLVQRTLLATYAPGPWTRGDACRALVVRGHLAAATVAARARHRLRRRRHA